MIWLSQDMVEALHRESPARFGGAEGGRGEGLPLSALAWAENIHADEPEADVYRLAAACCTGIARNHPFIDGTKRTGIPSAVVLLGLNGVEPAFLEAMIVTMVCGLAAGEVAEAGSGQWLRDAAINPPPP